MMKIKLPFFIVFLACLFVSCHHEPQKKSALQTLRLDFQEGDLPSLYPSDLMIHVRGISIAKNLYEGLTRIDAEGHAKLAGAKSVDISSDRLHYTFTLRDNFWSDGTPVTAYQYENAWKEALSPTSTCTRPELFYMIKNAKEAKLGKAPLDSVGIKAIDSKTLAVDLIYPSPYFLDFVSEPVSMPLIHPQQKEMTVFNGPFFVAKWDRGSLLQLKPNPHFWDKKHITLEQIDIYMIQDPQTAFAFFQEGKIDFIGAPFCFLTAEQIIRLQEIKKICKEPTNRVFWIVLNTKHLAISSPRIRQALGMALLRQPVTDHILIGGKPLMKPMPPAILPESGIGLQEDLAEARKQFDLGLKELGLTKETFPPLVITYPQMPNRKEISEYVQQSWTRAFGIKVELEAKDWNTLRANLAPGLFEITGLFFAPYYNDPFELMDYFSAITSINIPQWLNADYTKLLASAKQERDFNKRLEILKQAERILIEEMPFIPICTDTIMFAHNPHLHGYIFDCLCAIDFSYAYFK